MGTSDDGLLTLSKSVIFCLLAWKKRLSHSMSPLCLLRWKIYWLLLKLQMKKTEGITGIARGSLFLFHRFCLPIVQLRQTFEAINFNWSLFLNRLGIQLSIINSINFFDFLIYSPTFSVQTVHVGTLISSVVYFSIRQEHSWGPKGQETIVVFMIF